MRPIALLVTRSTAIASGAVQTESPQTRAIGCQISHLNRFPPNLSFSYWLEKRANRQRVTNIKSGSGAYLKPLFRSNAREAVQNSASGRFCSPLPVLTDPAVATRSHFVEGAIQYLQQETLVFADKQQGSYWVRMISRRSADDAGNRLRRWVFETPSRSHRLPDNHASFAPLATTRMLP